VSFELTPIPLLLSRTDGLMMQRTDGLMGQQRSREAEKQRSREAEKQRSREAEKQRSREAEKQRSREAEKQRTNRRSGECERYLTSTRPALSNVSSSVGSYRCARRAGMRLRRLPAMT
jgi:hypothetical protein